MGALTVDATSALLRALRARTGDTAPFAVQELRSRSWASVTFTGARHTIAFRIGGEDAVETADRFLDGLEAAEFTLRGHILADISLIARETCDGGVLLRLEALTVEDCAV